eukprot:1896355-Pyramimonas_sp.AAC.1
MRPPAGRHTSFPGNRLSPRTTSHSLSRDGPDEYSFPSLQRPAAERHGQIQRKPRQKVAPASQTGRRESPPCAQLEVGAHARRSPARQPQGR